MLDTATYKATYSPKLNLPPMRMNCERTTQENGLYCTMAIPADKGDDHIIAGDYYAWDGESKRIILLATEGQISRVTYGQILDGDVISYQVSEGEKVVFEGNLHIRDEEIEIRSVLRDYQGLNGSSTMTLYREN